MSDAPPTIISNVDLEQAMFELPDKVAEALRSWRAAELERKRIAGRLFLTFKAESADRGRPPSRETLEAMVESDQSHYEARLAEILAEAEHNKLYERLMTMKRIAGLREAF